MQLTNNQIYNYASKLATQFNIQKCDIKLPIKISFFLQKNMKILTELAQDIEKCRLQIVTTYGTLQEESQTYIITPDNIEKANAELTDLFTLEQNVELHTFKLEDFEGLEFTFAQMDAIMFMIEE